MNISKSVPPGQELRRTCVFSHQDGCLVQFMRRQVLKIIHDVSCYLCEYDALDGHIIIDNPAVFYDDPAIQFHAAIPHGYIVVPAGCAFAAALVIGAGREQEVAGKGAGRGPAALRFIAVKSDTVPQRLRVEPPAEVGNRIRVPVICAGTIIIQPIPHEFGIESAFHFVDKTVADRQPDLILDVPAIRQDYDIPGLKDYRAIGAAFIGEGVDVTASPVVKPPRRVFPSL